MEERDPDGLQGLWPRLGGAHCRQHDDHLLETQRNHQLRFDKDGYAHDIKWETLLAPVAAPCSVGIGRLGSELKLTKSANVH